MTQKLFREPQSGRRAWIFVLIGCYFFVETAFFRQGLFDRLLYLTFGLAVLAFGIADLLPRDQTRLSGLLRIGGLSLMGVTLAIQVMRLVGLAA